MNLYLILRSTLTAIANAIREKTGETGDMSPLEMPELIRSITGGGIESVEGTFTLENDSSFPTITHNFGTTKIAGFVIPHYSITAHAGYRNYFSFFINWRDFIPDGEIWIKDFTPYNSGRFPNPITVPTTMIRSLRTDFGYASPWTTQSDQWAGNYYAGSVYTNNTVRIGTGGSWASGTYYYKIFKLE